MLKLLASILRILYAQRKIKSFDSSKISNSSILKLQPTSNLLKVRLYCVIVLVVIRMFVNTFSCFLLFSIYTLAALVLVSQSKVLHEMAKMF